MKKRIWLVLALGILASLSAVFGVGCAEHNYGEWIIEKEATCTEIGQKYRVCQDEGCNDLEWEAIPMIPHDYKVAEITTTEHSLKCSVCGAEKTEKHNFSENNICSICEYDGTSFGLSYTLNEDNNSYTVSGVVTALNKVTQLIIPSTYNNLPVTVIGNSAFYDCSGLTSITIPDSVISIGDSAFSSCYKLVEVYNLSSLNITKGSTDNDCVGYCALNIYTPTSGESKITTTEDGYIFYEDGDTVYLMGYVGTNTELILPDNYNGKNYEIYRYAFRGCIGLTSITIPDNVTFIGYGAFEYCSGLTSIVIPDGVTSIGSFTFYGCSGLTSITIPDSIKTIGNLAFAMSAIAEVTIPDSVETIGYSAFGMCRQLREVVIPASVTSLGDRAFMNCSHLERAEVYAQITDLQYATFYNSVVTSAGNVYSQTALTEVVLSASITKIATTALYGNAITDIYFMGTEEQWEELYFYEYEQNDNGESVEKIVKKSDCISASTTIHFNYAPSIE